MKNQDNSRESDQTPVIGSPTFRPILFSTPMVRAILDGRKTQTRRIVKFGKEPIKSETEPLSTHECDSVYHFFGYGEKACPYGAPGDVIWVRETFVSYNVPVKHPNVGEIEYEYKADESPIKFRWKPGIHMPKEACRLFLQIKSVRVERLQNLSDEDAIAEGVLRYARSPIYGHKNYFHDDQFCLTAKESFQTLWQSINGHQSWHDNPFVWVIEFERIERPTGFC